jgi:hypothetical protein
MNGNKKLPVKMFDCVKAVVGNNEPRNSLSNSHLRIREAG